MCRNDARIFLLSWSLLHRYYITVATVTLLTVKLSGFPNMHNIIWYSSTFHKKGQIFYNGSNRNIFEVLTSILPIGTLVSVASLLATSSIKDILMGATSSIYIFCWNVARYKWKIHNGKIEIISLS